MSLLTTFETHSIYVTLPCSQKYYILTHWEVFNSYLICSSHASSSRRSRQTPLFLSASSCSRICCFLFYATNLISIPPFQTLMNLIWISLASCSIFCCFPSRTYEFHSLSILSSLCRTCV